jgi:hypothetical protein
MKSLRALVLMLAVGAFPGFLMQAHAQQEVDPDHFDQPSAQANVNGSKAQNHHKATAANQHHSNVKLAGKHSAAKSHHRAHVAA